MYYIQSTPNPSGAYPAPQSTQAPGLAAISDEQVAVLVQYNGFVTLSLQDDTVTAVEPNLTAWEAWKASQPAEQVEPSEAEDTAAMLVDHEYRLTLLELGLTAETV